MAQAATADLAPLAAGRAGDAAAARSPAVTLLQVMVLTLMAFPSDAVIHAIGGAGYAAAVVSYVIVLLYVGATMVRAHQPLRHHSPARTALCALWIVTLISYAVMNRALLNATQQTGADRWLLQMAGVTGIMLVASECLHSYADVLRVLRALTWATAFCGMVAAMQWWLKIDVTPYLRKLPGFTINAATGIYGIGNRGGVARVAGTGVDPIEMGVVGGMVLPIALYLAIYDTHRSVLSRYLPVALVAVCIPTSVSRSALLAAGIGVGALLISLAPARRLALLAGLAAGTGVLFAVSHHLIGTLNQFIFAGTSDNSITHRLNNYPYVEKLVSQAPWFGQGGGTYYFTTQVNILDNEYLTGAVELGLVGVAVLAFYLVWPALAALSARRRAMSGRVRDLCAVLAGAELAGFACSATFDSLSFPLFVNVQALVAGLIGAVWLIGRADVPPVPQVITNGAVRPQGG